MKKMYTQPVVEISTFDIDEIIMTSSVPGGDPTPTPSLGAGTDAATLSGATSALNTQGYVVVQW